MSMQDPVADMLTRIRNAQQANHQRVTMSSSKLKEAIVKVLKDEGYLLDYHVESLDNKSKQMTLQLKYFQGRPVIERIKRISRPGLRVYKSVDDLAPVPGFGVVVLTTSKGVMTHIAAKALGIGGEAICEVA